MMDDFAREFMKTEDNKITISYLIFQYDLDDLVAIDYLFDWQIKERVNNWYQVDITVNRNDWEAWDKAIKCEDNWVINDRRKGIYNVETGDFIDGKENWELKDSLLPICFIRHIKQGDKSYLSSEIDVKQEFKLHKGDNAIVVLNDVGEVVNVFQFKGVK